MSGGHHAIVEFSFCVTEMVLLWRSGSIFFWQAVLDLPIMVRIIS